MTMSRYVAALCRAGFKKADANHDGKIQPEEFDRSLADTPGKTAAEHHYATSPRLDTSRKIIAPERGPPP